MYISLSLYIYIYMYPRFGLRVLPNRRTVIQSSLTATQNTPPHLRRLQSREIRRRANACSINSSDRAGISRPQNYCSMSNHVFCCVLLCYCS